jgi:hypothetical protein
MRTLLILCASGLFALPLIPRSTDGVPPVGPEPARPSQDPREACTTGCAAVKDGGPELSEEEYRALIDDFAWGAFDERHAAFEALLFHGSRARDLVERLGTGALDAVSRDRLDTELARTHALLSVRLVAEDGSERVRLERARIPIGEKQHLIPETAVGIPAPEISGTLQRVGVSHLWARL